MDKADIVFGIFAVIGSTIDFTVNSKIIIEMHKPNHFIFPLTDENKYWKINRLVKAP